MLTKAVISKELFVGLDGVAHLCAGGESPMLKASREALDQFCELRSRGMTGRDRIVQTYSETKDMVASYLGAPDGANDIAFLASAADGLNVLRSGIEWHPGDHVLTLRGEFPNSLLPWLAMRSAGVTVSAVDPENDPEGALEAAFTARTRVVCVSYVSYLTGLRLDLARLATIAHSRGAILAVDASQALGVVPVPIEHCDVLVSCCYKFLLATHGLGIFYWNRRRITELMQPSVGWHSVEWQSPAGRWTSYRLKEGAVRFELGNPSFIGVFVLNQALKLLMTIDPQVLQQHVWRLGLALREGLVNLGLTVWSPEPESRRASNVVFGTPDWKHIAQTLDQHRVLAWGSDGRVRFSVHGYNDSGDVHAALAALSKILQKARQ